MTILIAGGTGNIGMVLIPFLLRQNHSLIILARNPEKIRNHIRTFDSQSPSIPTQKSDTSQSIFDRWTVLQWKSLSSPLELSEKQRAKFRTITGVINLIGDSLNNGFRWTAKRKKKILSSRVDSVRHLSELVQEHSLKLNFWMNASAIGIYQSGFLKSTCEAWETAVDNLAELHPQARFVKMRIGVVLSLNSPIISTVAPPVSKGLGIIFGKGDNIISWIDVEDVVRAIGFLIETKQLRGGVNLTNNNPMQTKHFFQTLSGIYQKKIRMHIPAIMLKLILGEKSALMLESVEVFPEKLNANRFKFENEDLQKSLKKNIFKV